MKYDVTEMEHTLEAIDEINKALSNKSNFICTNATGSGKSYLIKYVASCFTNPVLIVFNKRTSIARWASEHIDVVTYRSLHKIKGDYDAYIFDEVHHAGSEGCLSTFRYLLDSKNVYGFTATPKRGDGLNVLELFDKEINTLNFKSAIRKGVYNKPKYILSYIKDLDYGNVKVKPRLSDISTKELLWRYLNGRNKMIVFCSSNADLERDYSKLEKPLNELGFKTSIYTVKHKDEEGLEEFMTGSKHALFTCNLFNESFHVDGVDTIMLLRHTTSEIVINQQIGRIASFDTDRDTLIIDFACNLNIIRGVVYETKNSRKRKGIHRLDKLKEVVDVSFDLSVIDPWLDDLTIVYNSHKYYVDEFSEMSGADEPTIRRFLKRNKEYTDRDIEKVLFDDMVVIDGKMSNIHNIIREYNLADLKGLVKSYFKERTFTTSSTVKEFVSRCNTLESAVVNNAIDKRDYTKFCKIKHLDILDNLSVNKYVEHREEESKINREVFDRGPVVVRGKSYSKLDDAIDYLGVDRVDYYKYIKSHNLVPTPLSLHTFIEVERAR